MAIELPKLVPMLVGLTALVGTMFAIDARYLHQAEAAEAFQTATAQRERGDLETQLELARLELKSLKKDDSEEAKDRRDYLKARVLIIEKRLMDLSTTK